MITGQDIINLGFKPNKWFKEVIEFANENNLSGDTLKSYIESVRPKYIEPHTEPIPFFQKIKADYQPFYQPRVKPQRTKSFKQEKNILTHWIHDLEDKMWFEKNENIYLINPEHEADLKVLQNNLYIKKEKIGFTDEGI